MRLSTSILCAALLAATGSAQCLFRSVTMRSYGNPCTTVFQTPPTLAGSLDATNCTLQLTVTAFTGCCNTFLQARILALGLAPTNLPLPQVGPGCTLLVDPVVTLFLPSSGGDTFTLQLPPLLPPPLTLHAQAAAIYVTFGFAYDAQLTDGQLVVLQ